MQDITLKVRIKHGNLFSRNDQLLPCDLEVLRCENTSLYPYAYTWKAQAWEAQVGILYYQSLKWNMHTC